MLAGVIHAERGDYAKALAAARARKRGGYGVAQAALLRMEGEFAAIVGDTVGAIDAYSQYLRLRSEAEPALQPEVEQVRQRLAELLRERG